MTKPFGLQPNDLTRVMSSFGVAEAQVRRDHAVSHILATLSRHHRHELIFFGGTALSRTYLLDERLSEDIDLIATVRRDHLADRLIQDINAGLARTHGRITWSPTWSPLSDTEPAVAVVPDGSAIKIQLLPGAHYEKWPTELREIEQRYSDAPPAVLRVPTMPAFAGWKMAAWLDRRAARDLYDLWALSRVGALNDESARLFAKHGPTNGVPQTWMFQQALLRHGDRQSHRPQSHRRRRRHLLAQRNDVVDRAVRPPAAGTTAGRRGVDRGRTAPIWTDDASHVCVAIRRRLTPIFRSRPHTGCADRSFLHTDQDHQPPVSRSSSRIRPSSLTHP